MRARKEAPPRPAICPDRIDRTRQSYVAAIAHARSCDKSPNVLLDKANALLTLHWGRSDWSSRAEILKSVDWLLQVALRHRAPVPKNRIATLFPRSGQGRA